MFLSLLTAFLTVGIILLIADWAIHLSITSDCSRRTGWASYKKFKIHFEKRKWRYNSIFSTSLFGDITSGTEFHANIIKFEDDGMLIKDPISLLLCKIYVRKYIYKNFKKENRLW